jgi:hypothetical protein
LLTRRIALEGQRGMLPYKPKKKYISVQNSLRSTYKVLYRIKYVVLCLWAQCNINMKVQLEFELELCRTTQVPRGCHVHP